LSARLAGLLLLLAFSAAAGAQSCDPAVDDCTVRQALDAFRAAPAAQSLEREVIETNTPASGATFAGQVHNTYQDYLNLFAFAIDRVDTADDGNALIVRFVPLRRGMNLLALTLEVEQPGVAPQVQRAIPADIRAATVAEVESSLGQTEDLEWGAAYSFATTWCNPTAAGRCWGRTPSAYRDLLGMILSRRIAPADPRVIGAASNLLVHFPDPVGSVFERRLSQATNREALLDSLRNLAAAERGAAGIRAPEELKVLPHLIDGQPQLSITASYHTPGRLGGPKEIAAALELHAGRENVNTLRAACPGLTADGLAACLDQQLSAMAAAPATDDLVVSLSVHRRLTYEVDDLWLTHPVEGLQPVDIPGSIALTFRAQAGRQIATSMTPQPLRADLSIEGAFTRDDDLRPANRWTGTLTLSVPISGSVTMPVSIVYANKPEYLGDPTDRLGAHLGITYRLPSLLSR
jgi:hypothetical protein